MLERVLLARGHFADYVYVFLLEFLNPCHSDNSGCFDIALLSAFDNLRWQLITNNIKNHQNAFQQF